MATTNPSNCERRSSSRRFPSAYVDIDEERKSSERRFPGEHRQEVRRGLERARPDFGKRQAEAPHQCRRGGAPPAVLGADDHGERARPLSQPVGQCFDALAMALRARSAIDRRNERGDALVDRVLGHEISADAFVDRQRRRGGDRALGAVDQLKAPQRRVGRKPLPRLGQGLLAMDVEGRLRCLGGDLLRPCIELRVEGEKQEIFVERREAEQRREPVDAGRRRALAQPGAGILIGGRGNGRIFGARLRNERADPGKTERNRLAALLLPRPPIRLRPHSFLSGLGHGIKAPR